MTANQGCAAAAQRLKSWAARLQAAVAPAEYPDLAEKVIIYDKEHAGDGPGERIAESHGVDVRSQGHDQHNPQDTDQADAA